MSESYTPKCFFYVFHSPQKLSSSLRQNRKLLPGNRKIYPQLHPKAEHFQTIDILLTFTRPVVTSSYPLSKTRPQIVAQQLLWHYRMDICLTKSTFAGNVGTKPTSLKPAASPHTKQPTTIPAGSVSPTNTGKTVTTDKSQLAAHKKPTSETLKNSGYTVGKRIMTKTSLNTQANKKGRKRDQNSGTLSKMIHPAKSLMAQGMLTRPVVLDKAASAKAPNRFQRQVETQTPRKSVRLIADSSSPQTPSLIAQPAKPIATSPDQIVSATSKPENKLIQPTIDQSQIKSEIILPGIPDNSPKSNAQSEKDKDTGKMQVPDQAFVAKEKLVNQENGEELLHGVPPSDSKTITASKKLVVTDKPSVSESPKTLETNKTAITSKALTDRKSNQEVASEVVSGNSKITIAGEKPVVTDEPTVLSGAETTVSTKPVAISTPASNQKNQQSGKEPIPKTPISDSKTATQSKQSVVRNKFSAPDSSKTQLSNNQFAALRDQSAHSQQKVLIGQESPIPTAEKTTPNKADTDQKDHRGKTELFELPEKNRAHHENLSVKSIAQKMSRSQVQLSTAQAENRNNLLANQPTKPDMELGEQVLAGGNVQPGITEQSPASPGSAALAKIAGNADSGDSVGGQIQESIHSSFRSGSQQIVIRLNPPELGKVVMTFSEQGTDVTGVLQVDKSQTRDQIQQVLPEMIQNLQGSGISIKRLEVVLTNQQEQQTVRDQSSTAGQDSFSGQQGSSNPESQRNNTTYDQWLTNTDYVIEHREPHLQFTDNSINMLV